MVMPRRAKFSFLLSDQRTQVGYSLKWRDRYVCVQFPHPTIEGKYIELSTGCTTETDAHIEAAKLVLRHYAPVMPVDGSKTTWEEAIEHLKGTPDLRPDSIRGYLTAVRAVRSIINVKKPSDITEEQAHSFKREFLKGTFKRGKDSDAACYTRTPTSCATYLRSLRSLWSTHWKPAGFVRSNPWLEVPYPNTPKGKRVKLPNESAVTDLINWLTRRYPNWELPLLFIKTKLVAGCRTLDLCKAKSADLDGNSLTLSASVTKTRTARTVPLPADLANRLHKVKGPIYLWEKSVEECRQFRSGTRNQIADEFDPSTWRWTIQNLFREFNEKRAKKDQVRPHDLRARAITLVAAATQSVDATAEALGVDPQTARHYLDAGKAFQGSELLKKFAQILLPETPRESRV
jgi:integrase